ncbi:MAG: lauroyl acyltransferase [Hyphomicrobiales bacterium]|nr:lauroyl acyltransferase [Hyphomicrobiales bacterium]
MRYRLEYALFLFFGLIVRALPLETASSMVGALWRLIAPLSKRHRRALEHMKLAYPDSTEAERLQMSREMWDTMGRIFAESYRLKEIAFSDRVTLVNREAADAVLDLENGFVVCAAHQGNWEVGVAVLAQMGYRTAGIYQRLKNPYVDAAARRLREPLYPGGLLPKGDAAARAALRHVRNGGVISIMADLRENRGVRVPFFDRPAPSTPFPAMLAVTLGKKLVLGEVIRDKGVRFRVRIDEVEVVRTGDRDADILATTANLQRKIEGYVRARPGQWMWGHRRWG